MKVFSQFLIEYNSFKISLNMGFLIFKNLINLTKKCFPS